MKEVFVLSRSTDGRDEYLSSTDWTSRMSDARQFSQTEILPLLLKTRGGFAVRIDTATPRKQTFAGIQLNSLLMCLCEMANDAEDK
jgi:hypothetical protein